MVLATCLFKTAHAFILRMAVDSFVCQAEDGHNFHSMMHHIINDVTQEDEVAAKSTRNKIGSFLQALLQVNTTWLSKIMGCLDALGQRISLLIAEGAEALAHLFFFILFRFFVLRREKERF